MKKIMFNNKYGLTRAVLDGRKTQTRHVIKELNDAHDIDSIETGIDSHGKIYFTLYMKGKPTHDIYPRYQLEDVAVAQSYRDVNYECKLKNTEPLCFYGGKASNTNKQGWKNKMFVKAELMPHTITITNIRLQRLQDISDEDCRKEGIYESLEAPYNEKKYGCVGLNMNEKSPRKVFAVLIDKVSGKGTWDSNPWVFVYEFKLIK